MAKDDKKDLRSSNDNHSANGNPDVQATPDTTGSERRRFVKGAIAVPVILTVVSRPAMGGHLCTPSGFLSGNLSNTQDVPCNGRDIAYWSANFPNTYASTSFSATFHGVWHDMYGAPWDVGTKLKKVLNSDESFDQYRFGGHAVACYLNAVYRDQLAYPMQVGQVVGIVEQILMYGVFSDAATGMTMTAPEAVEFFKNTYY